MKRKNLKISVAIVILLVGGIWFWLIQGRDSNTAVSKQEVGQIYEFEGKVTDSKDGSMYDGLHFLSVEDRVIVVGGGWAYSYIDTFDKSIEVGDSVKVRAIRKSDESGEHKEHANYTLYECDSCYVKKK